MIYPRQGSKLWVSSGGYMRWYRLSVLLTGILPKLPGIILLIPTFSWLIIVFRAPHRSQGRVILPGQLIHASVCFIPDYRPKANFSTEMEGTNWENFLERGNWEDVDWIRNIPPLVELDLFDILSVENFISSCIKGIDSNADSLYRLEFLSCTRRSLYSLLVDLFL